MVYEPVLGNWLQVHVVVDQSTANNSKKKVNESETWVNWRHQLRAHFSTCRLCSPLTICNQMPEQACGRCERFTLVQFLYNTLSLSLAWWIC